MSVTTITALPDPSIADRRLRGNLQKGGFTSDPFTDVLRDGARKLIEQAIHAELAAVKHRGLKQEDPKLAIGDGALEILDGPARDVLHDAGAVLLSP